MIIRNKVEDQGRETGKEKRSMKYDSKDGHLELSCTQELGEPVWNTPQSSATCVQKGRPHSLLEDCWG